MSTNRTPLFVPALALVCLTIFTSAASAQSIAERVKAELDPIFDAPAWRSARWGIAVVDAKTSELLYERDLNKSFMPASNMKLYTTAAALEQLGPDFKYETNLYASGTTTTRGVLRGDLVVVGSGDPAVSGRYNKDTPTTAILRQWAQAVKNAGITRIEGAVVGDDDVFDEQPRSDSWQVGYLQEYYAAENSGLSVNDNCWDVVITPGKKVGDPASITMPIPTKYYKIVNQVKTVGPRRSRRDSTSGAEGTTATAAVADQMTSTVASTTSSTEESDSPSIEITRSLESNDIVLSGTIAADRAPYEEWGSIKNGTLFATTLFAEELERQGVRVVGGPKDIDDLQPAQIAKLKANRGTLLHTHQSPPLSKIIAYINKPSQNFYADQLLKTLGARTYGRGSVYAGRQAVRDFLTTAGASQASNLQMSDGSGLSRQDMVEPQMTVALLQQMAKSPHAQIFEESLPIMGVDGTLRTRLRGTPAHYNVKAKTGTIGGVRALSGYLTTKGGNRLIFAMMANNYTVPTSMATSAQDKALLKLIALDGETSGTANPGTSATTSTVTVQ